MAGSHIKWYKTLAASTESCAWNISTYLDENVPKDVCSFASGLRRYVIGISSPQIARFTHIMVEPYFIRPNRYCGTQTSVLNLYPYTRYVPRRTDSIAVVMQEMTAYIAPKINRTSGRDRKTSRRSGVPPCSAINFTSVYARSFI